MTKLILDSIANTDMREITSELGEWVYYYKANKTLSNIEGDESIAYNTGERLQVRFQVNDRKFLYDREGILEQGDATMFSSRKDAVEKDSKIVRANGEKFIIRNVITRNGMNMSTLYRLGA